MVEKRAVRRAYDELARAYDAARTRDGRGLSVLESFLEFGPERVLDAGCGGGQPVLDRLDDAATAVGLDASGEQLRLAADRVPGVALAAGDMTRLPFADDTFDAVVACGQISLYNATELPTGPRKLTDAVQKRLKIEGFIVRDYDRWGHALRRLGGLVRDGDLQYREHVIEGFENAPDAFLGLFEGINIGKTLVKVGEEPELP
jgi:SAM-dependent methyltransferase